MREAGWNAVWSALGKCGEPDKAGWEAFWSKIPALDVSVCVIGEEHAISTSGRAAAAY